MQYPFSRRFHSLPLNYLLQSLHFHRIFWILRLWFPIVFLSAEQHCVPPHQEHQNSCFPGISLGKALVTASSTELHVSPTGFALSAVDNKWPFRFWGSCYCVHGHLSPAYGDVILLSFTIPVLSSSLLVLSSFIPKQLQRLWILQNFHSPRTASFSHSTFRT